MEHFMELALQLAAKPGAAVAPNPRVGAVVVKDNKVIGQGWHKKHGGPHAEVEAVSAAGDCKGATLYVTLEPCSHHGKTPPCCELIIQAGFARVVCAMIDPNPQVAGRSIRRLKVAGIEVKVGLLGERSGRLNEDFIKFITTGMPFVSLKLALTLDGKIAAADGSSQWITGAEAREHVQQVRHNHQAIMVGSGTAVADNPRLSCRMAGAVYQPLKIVLDGRGRLSPSAKMFTAGQVWVVTREDTALHLPDATVLRFPDTSDLRKVLARLGELGVGSILLEGGGKLASSFINQGFVDKYYLYYAPKILGGRGRGFTDGLQIDSIDQAIDLNPTKVLELGRDWLAICYPRGN